MSKHVTHSSRDELIGDFCDQFISIARGLGTPQTCAITTGCRTHFISLSSVPLENDDFAFAVAISSSEFEDTVECKVISSSEDPEAVAKAAELAMTTRSQVLAGTRTILDLLA